MSAVHDQTPQHALELFNAGITMCTIPLAPVWSYIWGAAFGRVDACSPHDAHVCGYISAVTSLRRIAEIPQREVDAYSSTT